MNEMTNSHILVHEFSYLEPRTLEAALALLAQHGGQARPLAGGTDLLVQLKMERLKPKALVNISKVPGLSGIEQRDDVLWVGALTPIRALRTESLIQAWYPALAEASRAFSTTQVQYMGTVGGNLCNGSPASDSAPALIAYGAQLELRALDGLRRLPLEEFFLGPGQTALRPGELLTGLALPRPQPGTGAAFLKISRVAADIAKANAAILVVREGEHIADCRLVYGSVAPTPFRARHAESLLIGRPFSPELAAEVARAAAEEVSPINDVRSTAWYRRHAVQVMTFDGLQKAWQRSAQPAPSVLDEGRLRAGHMVDVPGQTTTSSSGQQEILSLAPGEKRPITLWVNGRKHSVWVGPNDLLLNVLREELALTGTKYGCGIGECGACTVQMDGKPVLACLVLAVAADGHDIVTVEGLQAPDGTLHPLQQAFIDHAAVQCGFCTPGMLMTAHSLLAEVANPTEDDVRDYLKGNLCRCTGYARIIRAVLGAAEHISAVPEVAAQR